MIRPPILPLVFALALAGAAGLAAQESDATDHSLRWARGVVTASAPGSVTLMLRTRSVSVDLKGVPPPAAGAVVEVHYSEKKNVRTAVWVFRVEATGSSDWSRKPGHSYWGVLQAAGKGSFQLALGKKTRKLELTSHTQLVEPDGHVVAKGKKDVAPLLSAGQRVVVKYEEEDISTVDGDTFNAASSSKAIEIRKLK